MWNELMNKMVRDSYAVLQSIVGPKPQAGDLKAMAIRICNCFECLKDPPNLYGEKYWVSIAVFYC